MTFSVRSKHRPIHFYSDKTCYFLTLKTINSKNYFNSSIRKKAISDIIQKAAEKFKTDIFAWVILDNHIHLLFLLLKGLNLPRFVHNISANISRTINSLDGLKGRSIFHSYWDYCIRDEKDFFLHFNYIHHNPVKHGYVKSQYECYEYKFCSYKQWADKKGLEWVSNCFETYPIRDFTVEE